MMKKIFLPQITITVITTIFLSLNILGNPDKSLKIFPLIPELIFLFVLLFQFILTFYYRKKNTIFNPELLIKKILPVSAIIIFSLSVFEFLTPPNTLFSITKINLPELFLTGFYFFLSQVMQFPKKWWKDNQDIIIRSLPWMFFGLMITISFWPFDYFLHLVKEDKPIEYLQVVILLLGVTLLVPKIISAYKKRDFEKMAVMLLLCASFLFISGDEISWGQRILNVETPDYFLEKNRQLEIGVHNFHSIETATVYIWILIGLVGAFGRNVYRLLPLPKLFRKIGGDWLPPASVRWYFLIPVLYFPAYYVVGEYLGVTDRIHPFSETMEILMYSGLVFTAWFGANKKN